MRSYNEVEISIVSRIWNSLKTIGYISLFQTVIAWSTFSDFLSMSFNLFLLFWLRLYSVDNIEWFMNYRSFLKSSANGINLFLFSSEPNNDKKKLSYVWQTFVQIQLSKNPCTEYMDSVHGFFGGICLNIHSMYPFVC